MSNIVTLEQAKRLKILGFNKQVFTFWELEDEKWGITRTLNPNFLDGFIEYPQEGFAFIAAPYVCQALDWIRENTDIVAIGIAPTMAYVRNDIEAVVYEPTFFVEEDTEFVHLALRHYDDYSEAESALLDEVLTYLEKKEKL